MTATGTRFYQFLLSQGSCRLQPLHINLQADATFPDHPLRPARDPGREKPTGKVDMPEGSIVWSTNSSCSSIGGDLNRVRFSHIWPPAQVSYQSPFLEGYSRVTLATSPCRSKYVPFVFSNSCASTLWTSHLLCVHNIFASFFQVVVS